MVVALGDQIDYISVEQFLQWAGVDVSRYTDTTPTGELATIIHAASAFLDGLTDTNGWGYREITEDEHPLVFQSNGTWEILPQYVPVRTITALNMVLWVDWSYSDVLTPVPSTVYRNEDNSIVSRWRPWPGQSNTVYPLFGYMYRIDPPVVRFSYTAGYDDGSIQDDGLTFPFPRWLVEATRLLARALIEQDVLSRMGMGGLESIKVGQVEARRAAGTIGFKIPDAVETLIARPPTRDDEIVLR